MDEILDAVTTWFPSLTCPRPKCMLAVIHMPQRVWTLLSLSISQRISHILTFLPYFLFPVYSVGLMTIISLVSTSEGLSVTAASLPWSVWRESHFSLPHQVQNWRRHDGGRFAQFITSWLWACPSGKVTVLTFSRVLTQCPPRLKCDGRQSHP